MTTIIFERVRTFAPQGAEAPVGYTRGMRRRLAVWLVERSGLTFPT